MVDIYADLETLRIVRKHLLDDKLDASELSEEQLEEIIIRSEDKRDQDAKKTLDLIFSDISRDYLIAQLQKD